ncbi:ribosome-associated translation inhibitor RaiA [Candidatus Oleimmundimicrobium sp.]|uniref:ribosome hibernation-promoting factor, HPF/YfiA family n=1 Tax=Candidatus Oleimmundimicrobium sp. TaxID=3060597 RepID=UPI00271B1AB0|nr:ribosome-associated translation inhibitor RaiA [Candidatus Oleimmundimicrobium sp.]MDO8886568.1 ribosome-associated translation inhibitor RaiA [Candidatus Oleimmundimicrobium sp.]
MQFIVKGHNIEVTDALRKHAEEKISKITRHFSQVMKIEVEFDVEKNPSIHDNQKVGVTIFTKGPFIKASNSSKDMYVSIDKVVDKLERQIEKYKGKTYRSNSKYTSLKEVLREQEISAEQKESNAEHTEPEIVKIKQFSIKPMSPEEAVMQMDLIGHSFFVFRNAITEETNVVYKRNDDNYGLIEPSYNVKK